MEDFIVQRQALIKRAKEFKPIWDTLNDGDRKDLFYASCGKPNGNRVVYYSFLELGKMWPVWRINNKWSVLMMDHCLEGAMDIFKDAEF